MTRAVVPGRLPQRCIMARVCRVLIVEGEYFLADDLKKALQSEGAEIIGPISELPEAIIQVDQDGLDAAVIDINLHDQAAYPVADKLTEQSIPFVFATGYSQHILPDRFWEVKRFEKPYDVSAIAKHVVELGQPWKSVRQRKP